MPKIITITKTVILPGKGILLATAGAVPVVEMRDTAADRVSLRVYTEGWKALVGEQIDDQQAPFAFDLNHLPAGSYEIEFRPHLRGKFLGPDRRTFRLVVSPAQPAKEPGALQKESGDGSQETGEKANPEPSDQGSSSPRPGTRPAQGPSPSIIVGATYPSRIESGKTYDGGGAEIDASSLTTVFGLSGHRDVVIRNWRVKNADRVQFVVDVWSGENVLIEKISIDGIPTFGAQVRRSHRVTVRELVANVVDSYLVYAEDVADFEASLCRLTDGSKNETGMRLMGSLVGIRLIRNTLRAWMCAPKCTVLRVQGYGRDVLIEGGWYSGLSNFGPMGEMDGGQCEQDPVKRRAKLARSLVGVRSVGVDYLGGVGLMAGLEAVFDGGKIHGSAGPEYVENGKKKRQNAKAYPLHKIGWKYPEAKYLKQGDPVRPEPKGKFIGVAFASDDATIQSLTYDNSQGPFARVDCTLNKRPV